MDKRRTLVIAVVVVMLVPGLAAGMHEHSVEGKPSLSLSLPDTTLTPGETTALELVVYNDGNLTRGSATNPELERRVTTARGLRVNVSDEGAPFTVETTERFVTALPEENSAPLSFRISVPSDARPGTYTVPVGFSYNYTDRINTQTGEENRTSNDRTIDVDLTVEDVARFDVVDVESNARVGATGTVAVTLRNTGSERARDSTVSLTSPNADLTFGGASSASRYAGSSWRPGETRTLEYRMTATPSASRENYTVTAQVAFEDDQGIPTRSESLSFGVVPQREQEFSIVNVDSDLAVDDQSALNVTLRNDGPLTARDTEVTITSGTSDIVFGESASASQYVGRWRPNTTRTVSVEATATPDAEARNYSFEAAVSYQDAEGDPGTASPLQFGIAAAPERNPSFAVTDVNGSLRVGSEGTLGATITNEGEEPADSLVVVLESRHQNIEALESEFSVGTLGPGDAAEFGFDLEVSDAAEAGPRQFTVHAEYRDEDNDPRTSDSFALRETVEPSRDTFDIAVENATVARGGSRMLEVTITNADDETLTDISAQMFEDDPIAVADGEGFVPELEPGESTTLRFEINAGANALTSKIYRLEMDFQYDDADGDTLLSDTYNVPVSVRESDSGGGLPPALVIGGVVLVLVAAGLGYRRYSQ